MTFARRIFSDDTGTLPRTPFWATSSRAESLEDVVFLSGAALNHLPVVLENAAVPQDLLRERLALRAAAACVAFTGRPERAGDLRDAFHLLRPGGLPGPAGETYLSWRWAVERPDSVKGLHRSLPGLEAGRIAGWLDAGQGAPVTRAARVLETVLIDVRRADLPALILADAALAQALGWDPLVPLAAAGLKRADLRKRGEDLRRACHRSVTVSAIEAARLAAELTLRAADLNAVSVIGW